MIEKEFDFEISEDDCESFKTVNDLVEFVARNFYAKWIYFIIKFVHNRFIHSNGVP